MCSAGIARALISPHKVSFKTPMLPLVQYKFKHLVSIPSPQQCECLRVHAVSQLCTDHTAAEQIAMVDKNRKCKISCQAVLPDE